QNDPDYEKKLLSLPKNIARALRFGDWSVFEGQVLESFRPNIHVCKPFLLEQGKWFKFCSMDWGWSKPYSIGFYAVNSLGRVIRYREMYGCVPDEYNVGVKKTAKQLAQEAWEFAVTDGIKDMVADPAIWTDEKIEAESKSIAQIFEEEGFNMIKANNDRVNGLVIVDAFFKQTVVDGEKDGKPNEIPMFQVFNTCKAFIRTIPMLTPNPNHPEDIDTKLEDHVYDDHRYALMSDFVAHPTTQLRKINGSWRQQRQTKEWDPF
nr:terminase [Treponema sp.]